jgi:ferredoxin-thioredoxin reductase catalytic subunit
MKEEIEQYALANNIHLGKHADRIIEMIERNNGNCPCVVKEAVPCPCPTHKEDILQKGKCKCGLFTLKKRLIFLII